jgi:hypothetical protein
MIFDTEFAAIELIMDELASINLYSNWTQDERDKRIIEQEILEARGCLEKLRRRVDL